ncbi:MAG: NTP transferase domain-containing protein [Acidobacteria bacterium]|nr:NTP transferase domain-containing protein [Acidobacteriota bacterium]
MKGIVLSGGTGSRLYPLTKVTNKHLLPVGQAPMIWHPIWKLVSAGVEEVLIVTGTEHMGDVVGLLGSGKDFGCRFTYKVQDEAGGIAQALSLAENFAGGSPVCVILGDNIFEDGLANEVTAFSAQALGARILVKEVEDPQRYGVAEVRGDRVLGIEEKPSAPKSNLAVTGIYFYDGQVYDIIRTLKPSKRGELEITDVNNEYLRRGAMTWGRLSGWWTDAGTFPSLLKANELAQASELPFPSLKRG